MCSSRVGRIGVDARLLSAPLTGIGRYTHEMVNALLRTGADLTLYMPGKALHWIDTSAGTYDVKSIGRFGRRGRFIWGQFVLPIKACFDAPDFFWGPTHRLPPFLPRKTRSFVTIHDLVWKYAGATMRSSSRLLEAYSMPAAIARSDGIIAVSHHTQADIIRTFPSTKAPIVTIYPGVSDRPAGHDKSYLGKWGINRPYVLFVGTLEPRKNLLRLLDAYSRLSCEIRQMAQLVIAGGQGWGDLNLSQKIEELGLINHISLTGYVDEVELSTLYKNALFLAMPSLYEGFGLPLVEAMSYNLPCLTSSCASMPEVVGEAGLLVDPLDVDSIKMGLQQLITDVGLRARMSAFAATNAELFKWDAAADQLLNFFEACS